MHIVQRRIRAVNVPIICSKASSARLLFCCFVSIRVQVTTILHKVKLFNLESATCKPDQTKHGCCCVWRCGLSLSDWMKRHTFSFHCKIRCKNCFMLNWFLILLKIYSFFAIISFSSLEINCQIAVCADWLSSPPRVTNVCVQTVTSSEMKMTSHLCRRSRHAYPLCC